MNNLHPATFVAAVAAVAVLAAMPLTAGSAAARDADAAAQAIYQDAVAGCGRMKATEARRCMRDAEAARAAAEIKARTMPGHAKLRDRSFPHAVEGATGDTGRELRAPGSGTPTYWIAPDVKDVPDNLADNVAR